jgi:hypothetical protein
MVMIHDCIACQDGFHDQHIGTPGPVPEGLIGGWECHCPGDCAERYARRIERNRGPVIDTTDYASLVEALEHFRKIEEAQS